MSTLRLAHCGPPEALVKGLAPSLRLAIASSTTGHVGRLHKTFTQFQYNPPALLVSYVYLDAFQKNRDRYDFRDWVLDSGAFSAMNSGKKIDVMEFTELCKHLIGTDKKLTEIFALDVIGDWRATMKNVEYAWKQGVPAIPTYHVDDDDWSVLEAIARDYPKIAIGGMTKLRGKAKLEFPLQAFARVWPKKVHGFGVATRDVMLNCPFHSVDATSWEMGPCAFGSWRTFGNMSVRGSTHNLRAEVEHYLELERLSQFRWRKEMAMLEKEFPIETLYRGKKK